MEVSLFKHVKNIHPQAKCSISHLFDYIKKGNDECVSKYRETGLDHHKKEAACFTASGVFDKRAINGLVSYNGIICIDIDYKDQDGSIFDSLIDRFKKWNYVWAYHKSIGGKGYAFYFKTENKNPDLHKRYFDALSDTIESTGLVVDRGCSDISRLRFVSNDKDLHVNDNASIWDKMSEIKKTEHYTSWSNSKIIGERLESCTKLLKEAHLQELDLFDSYEMWKRGAFAISASYGESGRQMFHVLCSHSDSYNEADTDKIYDRGLKYSAYGEGAKTLSTIFDILKRHNILQYGK